MSETTIGILFFVGVIGILGLFGYALAPQGIFQAIKEMDEEIHSPPGFDTGKIVLYNS